MSQICRMADALDAGARRKRRVHQHHGGTQVRQIIGDGLRVVTGNRRIWEQPREQPGADGGDLVQMQRAAGVLAERTFVHDGEHASAGRGLLSRPLPFRLFEQGTPGERGVSAIPAMNRRADSRRCHGLARCVRRRSRRVGCPFARAPHLDGSPAQLAVYGPHIAGR